jgi:hypothetical protein
MTQYEYTGRPAVHTAADSVMRADHAGCESKNIDQTGES